MTDNAERLDDLRRKLEASERVASSGGMKERIAAIKAEIARLEQLTSG